MTTDRGRRPRIGWVVDVQNDFMLPSGRLYVRNLFNQTDPGATAATAAIERTVAWMRAHCDVMIYTGDWHAYGDREIDTQSPDATRGTYPPHCMGMSPNAEERAGAALLASIDPGPDVLVLARDADADDARTIARRAVGERRPIFVQKSEFSVFEGNRAIIPLLTELEDALGDTPEIVVCGVATDVCVKQAVDGLLDRRYRLHVVTDAMWGLGLLGPAHTFELWSQRGATLRTTEELDAIAR